MNYKALYQKPTEWRETPETMRKGALPPRDIEAWNTAVGSLNDDVFGVFKKL